jgi:hypothetical protein
MVGDSPEGVLGAGSTKAPSNPGNPSSLPPILH